MSLFSSIIITIILSYAIIRIYIILHIYLQICIELRGWQKCNESLDRVYQRKLIQYTSTEYHLHFQECSFKYPNVFLRFQMFLMSRLHKQPHYMKFKQIYILDSNLHQKQEFDFYKRNSYTNACLKFLCDAKLITSLLIF